MKNKKSSLGLLTLFLALSALLACGSDDPIPDPLNSAGLSADEATAITNALIDTMNASNSDLGNSSRLSIRALTTSVPLSGAQNCPLSGHITYSGNITITVDTDAGTSSTYGLVTFSVSDPTNNLNDCEVAVGVILDGTLTLTMSGNSTEGVGLSLVGTIGINERGSGGGLVPRGACFVNLNVARGSSTATGSVCGNSI
ncbi:MAG TPA: hypothetical protein VI895_10150 [Bdellovibrionota bacterium]|nr:hypothetical protein [Bdellovibrionota bacterium]